ncbi:hypothetical protein PRK78_004072 [Emydomyces testavorans]|uniref:BZIP domain-containing protein n=1 Tax=Emydomyces testavorans TaxID=2070801 RepID=A0AAF0IL81_9EURO|nr:hypothetical protein PRK78_004072 [Emydomyces testavorans]
MSTPVSTDSPFIPMPYLKTLGAGPQKKTRVMPIESQPPKRRGPKPDSKPAQTRRQELNRQAQRTHRERKEQYIRALEIEISRLREGYSNDITAANMSLHQQRQNLEAQKEENRILREILMSQGFNVDAEIEQRKVAAQTAAQGNYQESSAQSQSASYPSGTNYMTPDTTVSSGRSPAAMGSDVTDVPSSVQMYSYQGHQSYYGSHPEVPSEMSITGGDNSVVADTPGVFDQDPQLGIDFILTLEGTCRDHLERLCRRAHDDQDQDIIAGHILMATCPPPSEIAVADRGCEYPVKTYDLPPANLNTLLNLSRQLVTDHEITPIMALQSLMNHEMYPLLTRDDIKRMMEDLVAKVRCYGFGAVIEDFEFRDALNSVLGSKTEQSIKQEGLSQLPLRLG